MLQPNMKRKERNRKPRWRAKYDEYCEDQVPGACETDEAQTKSWRHREQVGAQYQGGGLYEEAELFLADCARSATVSTEEQPNWAEMSVTWNSMGMFYQQQISTFCLQFAANGHCQSK